MAAGGSNYNRLTSSALGEIDQPSGNAVLNGIAVRVERIAQTDVVAA